MGAKGNHRLAVQPVPCMPARSTLHTNGFTYTCSVAQAQAVNTFQPTWHKRPRAEASLGNARGPSPMYVYVYVCRWGGGHKMARNTQDQQNEQFRLSFTLLL